MRSTTAYGVLDHRPTVIQRFIALAFALGSVAVLAVTVEMMVSGPLGELTGDPAKTLGIEGPYSVVWSVVRWPIGLALVVGFLVCLYRFCANVRQRWRECLPGAVVGASLWIGAAVAFRLTANMRDWRGVASNDPSVTLIGQAVNAVVSTVLWAYLASIAILLGGEVNALLRARARQRALRLGRASPPACACPAPVSTVTSSAAVRRARVAALTGLPSSVAFATVEPARQRVRRSPACETGEPTCTRVV